MFWLLRTIVSVVVLAAIAGLVIYFLPHNTKLEIVGKISGIVPESIKEETEELFFTPVESREKILAKLEENFEALKEAAPEKAKELVSESEAMLQKLKEKNEEQSIAELAKQKLLNLLVKDGRVECK